MGLDESLSKNIVIIIILWSFINLFLNLIVLFLAHVSHSVIVPILLDLIMAFQTGRLNGTLN